MAIVISVNELYVKKVAYKQHKLCRKPKINNNIGWRKAAPTKRMFMETFAVIYTTIRVTARITIITIKFGLRVNNHVHV